MAMQTINYELLNKLVITQRGRFYEKLFKTKNLFFIRNLYEKELTHIITHILMQLDSVALLFNLAYRENLVGRIRFAERGEIRFGDVCDLVKKIPSYKGSLEKILLRDTIAISPIESLQLRDLFDRDRALYFFQWDG